MFSQSKVTFSETKKGHVCYIIRKANRGLMRKLV